MGSSGYIGSNLYKYFKKKDFKTIGISRKSSSTTTHLVNNFYKDCNYILSLIEVNDVIINCLSDKHTLDKKNCFILFLIPKISLNIKFVQISSLSVYISSETCIIKDEETKLIPNTKYGKLKLKIENEIIKNTYIKSYLILRIGGVFGRKKLPLIIRFKKNLMLNYILKIIFYENSLYLINIRNLEKKIFYLLKNDLYHYLTINIFYKHNFICSNKNIINKLLKNLLFKKYYLKLSNSKMKKIFINEKYK